MTVSPELAWAIADRVGHAHAVFTEVLGRALEGQDVSTAEFIALVVLSAAPEGLSQSDWARLQGVSRQRAHVVARGLEGRGWVRVQRQGRASTVVLAPQGGQRLESLSAQVAAALSGSMGTLTGDEARQLLHLLGRLLADEPVASGSGQGLTTGGQTPSC